MMKKEWVRPQAMVQNFVPNEYVATCYVAEIQCVYPGNGTTNGDGGGTGWSDGTSTYYDDYNGKESGYWYGEGKNYPHGACGNTTSLTISEKNLSGYETTGRSIYNIQGWTGGIGTFYCTWNSYYGYEYNHKGRVVVKYEDSSRPNRS